MREQNVKEMVDELDRIVSRDKVQSIFLACDEVLRPMLNEHLPPHLREKVIDTVRMDIRTPEHEVMQQTLDAMRKYDAETDVEKVDRMMNEYRAGGLGVVGVRQTLAALRNGQVDELLISAQADRIEPDHERPVRDILEKELGVLSEAADEEGGLNMVLSDALVTRARQTGAKVTFIEDPALLDKAGGVGALLRYRHAGVIQ
jgi:peptide subunit release factor 1 (eRF1)